MLELQYNCPRILLYCLIILLSAGIIQSCKDEKQCSCPINRPTTSVSGTTLDSTNRGYSIDGNVDVTVPKVKRLIKANANLSSKIYNKNVQVESTYWEILGGNPEITQHTNLFWTTACALYEIACADKTINDIEREAEKRIIVMEYEAKFTKILEGTLSRSDNQDKPDQNPSEEDDRIKSNRQDPPIREETDQTESENIKEIMGSVYGKDEKPLANVEVWCASCSQRETGTTNAKGYFSFKRYLNEKFINQQIKICFRYSDYTDCAWIHYNYLDEISITPKFE